MSAPSALKLGYSLCWEDPAIELEALAIPPGATVVAIASAGCNVLSLLTGEAGRVVAVDYNPYQTALADLKSAAVAALSREEYLAFAGEAPSSARVHTYREKLAPALRTDDARRFWAGRSDWLERGIQQAGSLEHHFGLWRGVMRMVQGDRRIRRLFECRSLAEQKKFFDAEWNRTLYRGVVRMFFNRRALSLAKHPDHFRYVTEKDIAGSFLLKSQHALTDLSVRDNYFLAQIFLGRYLTPEAVPPFLQVAGYEQVRERLDRLELVTGDMASALDGLPAGGVRAFYLSNICEWMPDQEVERLFEAMTRAAAPGARATLRTLLAERDVPARYRERWKQLEPLSTELHFRDRSFLYSTYRVLELA